MYVISWPPDQLVANDRTTRFDECRADPRQAPRRGLAKYRPWQPCPREETIMRNSRHNDTADGVAVRHLDDIREEEPGSQSSRLSALVLASFGGATIVFCALALMRTSSEPTPKAEDPLGALVKQSTVAPPIAAKRQQLTAEDVTFPAVLSDQDGTTTAMELVRAGKTTPLMPSTPQHLDGDVLPLPYDTPPEAGDRLPVVPLPAQDMVPRARSVVGHGDTLRTMAQNASREDAGGKQAEAGKAGRIPVAGRFLQASRRRGGVQRRAASPRSSRPRREGPCSRPWRLAPRAHRTVSLQALSGHLSAGFRGQGTDGDLRRQPAQKRAFTSVWQTTIPPMTDGHGATLVGPSRRSRGRAGGG